MFQKLVSHNGDLERLVKKGYAVAFDEGYLVIRDIPYLGAQGELLVGAIVAKLVMVDKVKVQQDNHQIYFAGSSPHGLDGKPIPNLGDQPSTIPLSASFSDVVVQRAFSNKPKKTGAYADFFEKIESYVALICGPAIERHGIKPYTFKVFADTVTDSVFLFNDTMTSRAEIGDLSAKLKDDIICLIGLGGTGAYLLDHLAKTHAREIRVYDRDDYHVHNAFRSPGKLDEEDLGKPKADVYASRYANFRKGIVSNVKFVDSSCDADLDDVTFAFVCVDKGSSRRGIFELLLKKGIPFIDVGLGLNRKHGSLTGMIRVTFYSKEHGMLLCERGLSELNDAPDDLYRANVQIGELNALNACLAMMRFKQIRGFYGASSSFEHLIFNISNMSILGQSFSGNVDETQAS